jgi:hypothetical protein
MSGMVLESDEDVIKKILINTDEKYNDGFEFQEGLNGLEFKYSSTKNYYQKLLRKK